MGRKASPAHPWRGKLRQTTEEAKPTHKICTDCHQSKPLADFSHQRNTCKPCRNVRESTRWRNRDAAARERTRAQNSRKAAYHRAYRRRKQTSPPHRYWPIERAAVELEVSTAVALRYARAGALRRAIYLRRIYVDPADVAAVQARRAMGDLSLKHWLHTHRQEEA